MRIWIVVLTFMVVAIGWTVISYLWLPALVALLGGMIVGSATLIGCVAWYIKWEESRRVRRDNFRCG
jgi:hypothetical protein